MHRIALHVIISQINNITLMFFSGVCFFFFSLNLMFLSFVHTYVYAQSGSFIFAAV